MDGISSIKRESDGWVLNLRSGESVEEIGAISRTLNWSVCVEGARVIDETLGAKEGRYHFARHIPHLERRWGAIYDLVRHLPDSTRLAMFSWASRLVVECFQDGLGVRFGLQEGVVDSRFKDQKERLEAMIEARHEMFIFLSSGYVVTDDSEINPNIGQLFRNLAVCCGLKKLSVDLEVRARFLQLIDQDIERLTADLTHAMQDFKDVFVPGAFERLEREAERAFSEGYRCEISREGVARIDDLEEALLIRGRSMLDRATVVELTDYVRLVNNTEHAYRNMLGEHGVERIIEELYQAARDNLALFPEREQEIVVKVESIQAAL